MEGIRMDLIMVSLINLTSMDSSWSYYPGALLSLIFFCYYGLYAFFIYKFIKEIQAKMAEMSADQLKQAKGSLSGRPSSWARCATRRCCFTSSRSSKCPDESPDTVLQPIVNVVRDFVIHLCFSGCGMPGRLQVAAILCIESANLVYVIKTRQKFRAFDNYIEALNRLMFVLYNSDFAVDKPAGV
jgi:hypothetical protein